MSGNRFYRLRVIQAGLLAILACPAAASAQTTQADAGNLPLLQQLNNETQALFQTVKLGLVRVELPPRWTQDFEEAGNPFLKWNNRLNAEMREKLRELQIRPAADHGRASPVFAPSTQPVEEFDLLTQVQRTLVAQRPAGVFNFTISGDRSAEPSTADSGAGFPPTTMAAILLDQSGHVLLPVFVSKETFADRPLIVIDAGGETLNGRFVGSDRQTGLTVLQLDRPTGKPLSFSGTRPVDGSLLMLLTPSGESGRLSVWTGESQEWGMVISVDGTVHGFLRNGHFLCADSIRPLAEQLVRYGQIRRAFLGVDVTQVKSMNGRRALRVDGVHDQSAAASAGLKEGDLICSFAGTAVSDFPNFSAAIAESNGSVDLMILRDGHPISVTVELHPQ